MQQLRKIADGLWVEDGRLSLLGMQLGHRMTVARLDDETLWVHSPSEFSADLKHEIDDLGDVSAFVAPTAFHDLFWDNWIAAYPSAARFAPSAFARLHPTWDFKASLPGWVPETWRAVFDLRKIEGIPKLDEVVFLHRASGTLIVADLVFNLPFPDGDTGWNRVMMKLNGCHRKVTPTRFFKTFIRNRSALKDSVDEVLSWEFERMIVSHGENLDTGAREALRSAYAFLR